MNTYLIAPSIVAVLALILSIFASLRRHYEKVIPLLFICGVYTYAAFFPAWEQDTRQLFVRSSLTLYLFVDVLYVILEYIKSKGR